MAGNCRRGAQTRGWRLFTKNTGLCEAARRRIQSDACPVLEELRKRVRRKPKLATEAPINGGRNYDGPKVAKFLVG